MSLLKRLCVVVLACVSFAACVECNDECLNSHLECLDPCDDEALSCMHQFAGTCDDALIYCRRPMDECSRACDDEKYRCNDECNLL